MCQARGVCLELLRWWNTQYTAEGPSMLVGEFTTHLFMTQAAALLNYKQCVEDDNREGAPGCTLDMLTRQIVNVLFLILPGDDPCAALQNWKKARRNLSSKKKSGSDDRVLGFSIQDWDHITIKERQAPEHYGKHYSADASGRDLTPSQRHQQTFSPLVLHNLTRRSWTTRVMWSGRSPQKSALNINSQPSSLLTVRCYGGIPEWSYK